MTAGNVSSAVDSAFLEGGGELGALLRAFDWTKTPLGPPALWPRSLKTAVRIMLTSRQPIWIGWGGELTYLYNDPYKSIIGGKHPSALGRPFREVWREIWDVVGPMADHVMNRDEGTYVEAQLLIMERHGYQEETYYTFSYSPIPNDDGGPGGLICANTDDTRRVIGERQVATLRELAARTADARTAVEACERAVDALATNPRDVPFALVCTAVRDRAIELVAATAGAEGISRPSDWPCDEVIREGRARIVELDGLAEAPTGAWPRPPSRAAVIPLAAAGQTGTRGAIVVGLSPFRQLDESYQGFLDLVGKQVTAGIANAEAYEQERKRAEALAQLDQAKTAFFSNVSHEFRTPLTLMLGPLEDSLARSDRLPPEDRERLEVTHRNALRLLKLVNTLLDFSRIEAGRIEASFEPTDLSSLTAELASQFRSALERAGLSLVVQCQPLDEPVWVDRSMWEKIVFNLLSNAYKFTFEGEIAVSLARNGDQVVLAVRDTGTGIPADELPHLFERFHRVKGARGRTFEGSGIGLSLVQELVRLHGGTVDVESEVGRGSTFSVAMPIGRVHLPDGRLGASRTLTTTALPRSAYIDELASWSTAAQGLGASASAAASVRGTVMGPTGTARILLADDNADMRNYVQRLLGDRYEVEAVGDGVQALAAARARRPDLVVTDVMMPGLDGFGLLRQLRADETLSQVPVIMLSARAGEEARVEGVSAGADDYLAKPFSARELLARVTARLEMSMLHRRLADERSALRDEAQALDTLDRIGRMLVAEPDLDRVLQAVTDAATEVSGAKFGAFFYNVQDESGGAYLLYTLSGAPREAFDRLGTPRNTAVFAPTFSGEGPVRLDDVTKDPRYGQNAPHHGMPNGHLPVRSYLAVPVVSRSGDAIGGLFFGHPEPGVFGERAERLVTGIAAHAAIAIDNARQNEQRLRLIGELREADRKKDEFLATLSHELRNPLAPLRHAVQLLRMDDGEDAERLHDMMERQVDHLVRLVDDLLELSRINRGAFDLHRDIVDISAVVRSAVETADPLVRASGHSLSVELPDRPLWVDGDAVRLDQVIGNLLNNAVKYTPTGGNISVRASADRDAAVISVRDDGEGIGAATLPHIFEMFSRGDHAGGRGPGGLGIGLALARKLAEMHGGSLTATSDGPGRGSEFVLRAPLSERAREAPAAEVQPPSPVTGKRVLVVDDNVDAAETLGLLLSALGADARVVHDGERALEAMKIYQPDLVILDIGMPGMDGYEIARRIRADFSRQPAKLVALTGWGQEEDRRRAEAAGFDHHLTKPADIAVLRSLLG